MRILNLSLDREIIEKGSAVRQRLILLAEKVGEIVVFVPGERDEKEEVSTHLTVYSFAGPRVAQLWKMWKKGKEPLSGSSSFPKGGGEFSSRRILNPSSDSEVGVLPLGKGELRVFELITVQDPHFLGLFGVLLAKKYRVPLEVQVHGFEKSSGLRKRLARFVLERADTVRAVSNRLKEHLHSIFHIPYSILYTLPVYAQTAPPQKVIKRKTVPYPFTFLTVGRLVPVKNIDLQIRAFARLVKEVPHIRLRIVGEGPLADSLKSKVESLTLEKSIIFEGYQRDLRRYYEEADAFLLTSDCEGWGRVVLEAAAYRLPIIMTDVGLAREVIKNEESGFIIPVGDERELMLAMKELLDKPQLRERLGEGAFRAFKALPSREAYIEKQVEEWRSLI